MSNNYRIGDSVYIIQNNRQVIEVKIIKKNTDFYVVQLPGSTGGIQLREGRLFRTKEEAEEQLPEHYRPKKKFRSPYDYGA